jgi:hypothetical protein
MYKLFSIKNYRCFTFDRDSLQTTLEQGWEIQ